MSRRKRNVPVRGIIMSTAMAAVVALCVLHLSVLPPGGQVTAKPRVEQPPQARVEQPPKLGLQSGEPEVQPPQAQVEQPPKPRREGLQSGEPEVHVIFSTDCSGYQHWQSIALWYSSRQAGQRGAVTRIASGCDDDAKQRIAVEWREIDETGLFRCHHAPKGELKGNYKYSNKPSGLYHWLTNADPKPFVDETRGIVALLDPDMLLLRPLTAAVGVGLVKRPGVVKARFDASGQPRVLAGGDKELDALPPLVAEGRPVAQEYGIGGAWGNAGKPNARPSWKDFDRNRVCGTGPCTRTDAREADAHYSVGPPYLVHAADALKIAKSWTDAVPHVHDQYPHLLAEMYAYSMAAANLSLPHTQIHNLMVSNVGAGGEGWDWVDGTASSVCQGAGLSTPPTDTVRWDARFTNRDHAPGPAAPSVLHFCQSYKAADHKFGKHSVRHDLFSCDAPLFAFDPAKLARYAADAADTSDRKPLRSVYFLCNILPRLNAALLEYKRTVCPKRGIANWNEAPQ